MASLPRLFIDKLFLTIPLEPRRGEDVLERLQVSVAWREDLSRPPRDWRYCSEYELDAPNGETVTLYADPRARGTNFLKLEYSPNNIGDAGSAVLSAHLHEILGRSYRRLFYAGFVRRIDLAFDAPRISPHDLWVQDRRTRKTESAIIRGRDLQTETIILGYDTTRQLIVYDKMQEQAKKRRQPLRRHAASLTRIEYRYEKGKYRLDEQYCRMRRPLHNFWIRRYAPIAGLSPALSRAVFDALRLRGGTANPRALRPQPNEDLTQYESAFLRWDTWDLLPLIWSQARDRIDELLPPIRLRRDG